MGTLSVHYHKDKWVCDFLIVDRGRPIEAIQVTWKLEGNNKDQELNGFNEAMGKFNIKKGMILTYDQEMGFGNIKVIPVWKWLLG